MNILPKKRWHVRTRDNMARVRRDEAKAAAELKETERRIKLADQEARMSLLRNLASEKMTDEQKAEMDKLSAIAGVSSSDKNCSITTSGGHVNFFADLEGGDTTAKGHKEHDAENKKEQEEYEKKMGILVYLGQDTNELTGDKSWWEKVPEDRKPKKEEGEVEVKPNEERYKDLLDPLSTVRKYLGTDGIKDLVKKSDDKKSATKRTRSPSPKSKISKKKRKKDKHKKKSKKNHSSRKKSKKRRRSSSSSDSDSDSSDDRSSDKKSKKYKKHKKSSRRKEASGSESDKDKSEDNDEKLRKRRVLENLRKERLEREQKERDRANHVLYGIPMKSDKKKSEQEDEDSKRRKGQKYNSQFNPELAKQNKLDAKKKYWLE